MSLAFIVLCALVSVVVTIAVGGLALIGVVVQPLAALDWLFTLVAAVVASLVAVPIVVGSTSLYYIDLRTRTEGIDMVIEAREVLTS
jgi:ABC-type molybdate transport system permease subunit